MPRPAHTPWKFWWKLGWISFGGPAGQIAIMHKEIVEDRQWMTEGQFLRALNFTMLLPGPEAQQLATYLGWKLNGWKGGLAAGGLFVLPSVLILFGLSWVFMAGGHLDWVHGIFHGLAPAVIAIVFMAAARLGRKALQTPSLWALALLSLIAIRFLHLPFPSIIIAAALIGAWGSRFAPGHFLKGLDDPKTPTPENRPKPVRTGVMLRRALAVATIFVALWWLPILLVGQLMGWNGIHFQQGLFFSKAAMVTFGGAYAVLPYVAQQAVETHGWLSQSQMITGLGLAETTPGPLIMVLQFVGFVGGWQHPGNLSPLLSAALGAAITTWATFLPCFLFVFLGAPYVESLGRRPGLAAALNAVTAAVVGVILNLALWFAWHTIRPESGQLDYFVLVVALGAWLALKRFKIGVVPTMLVCAMLGLLQSLI